MSVRWANLRDFLYLQIKMYPYDLLITKSLSISCVMQSCYFDGREAANINLHTHIQLRRFRI